METRRDENLKIGASALATGSRTTKIWIVAEASGRLVKNFSQGGSDERY